MKIVCVANPTSGGGKGALLSQDLQKRFAAEAASDTFILRLTTEAGAARRIAHEAVVSEVPDFVLVVGGDGTLSEVVDGLFSAVFRPIVSLGDDTQPPQWGRREAAPPSLPVLVYVPAGTGADFARLGYGCTPDQAVSAVRSGCRRSIDVGYVLHVSEAGATRFFINVASLGLGSAVVARAEQIKRTWVAWLGGLVVFLLASAIELLALRKFDLIVKPFGTTARSAVPTAADGVYRTRATTMAFCNGRYFGGGMAIAPSASPCDGSLNLSIWREGLLGFILGFVSVYTGRASTWSSTSNFVSTHCYVAADVDEGTGLRREVRFEVDGESGGQLPAFVGLAPAQVTLAVPPEGLSAV